MAIPVDQNRRYVLGVAASLLAVSSLSPAANLLLTPRQSEGPFYPVKIPLDHDNDLVTVAGRSAMAEGEIVNVVGQVLDKSGKPLNRAQVEIWQCDNNGRYHHPGDRRNTPLDANFQGYGRFTTGEDGAYRFRTIKPVSYPGRAPHIHFIISGPGFEPLTTQMYLAGHPQNERDFLFNNAGDKKLRDSLSVRFEPAADGVPLGHFNIVLAADGRHA